MIFTHPNERASSAPLSTNATDWPDLIRVDDRLLRRLLGTDQLKAGQVVELGTVRWRVVDFALEWLAYNLARDGRPYRRARAQLLAWELEGRVAQAIFGTLQALGVWSHEPGYCFSWRRSLRHGWRWPLSLDVEDHQRYLAQLGRRYRASAVWSSDRTMLAGTAWSNHAPLAAARASGKLAARLARRLVAGGDR